MQRQLLSACEEPVGTRKFLIANTSSLMCVDDTPFFVVSPQNHYHGRRISCLPWLSFYGLAGDSMHNMKFTLILIPASGPIVSFKFSLLCTNSSKTLPWPISTAVARKPRAASSPVKSTSPQASSTPSVPPATAPPKNASPPANSKSSSPSSANHKTISPKH